MNVTVSLYRLCLQKFENTCDIQIKQRSTLIAGDQTAECWLLKHSELKLAFNEATLPNLSDTDAVDARFGELDIKTLHLGCRCSTVAIGLNNCVLW